MTRVQEPTRAASDPNQDNTVAVCDRCLPRRKPKSTIAIETGEQGNATLVKVEASTDEGINENNARDTTSAGFKLFTDSRDIADYKELVSTTTGLSPQSGVMHSGL